MSSSASSPRSVDVSCAPFAAAARPGAPRPAQRYLAWTLIGTSLATLAAETLTGLGAASANGRAERLEQQRSASGLTAAELEEYHSMRTTRTELRSATVSLFAASAVIGAGGLLLYEPTYVAPQATSVGVRVGGRF